MIEMVGEVPRCLAVKTAIERYIMTPSLYVVYNSLARPEAYNVSTAESEEPAVAI